MSARASNLATWAVVLALLFAVPSVVAIRDTSLESVAIGLLILDAILASIMLAISFSAREAGKHGFADGDAEGFALAEASAAAEAAIP